MCVRVCKLLNMLVSVVVGVHGQACKDLYYILFLHLMPVFVLCTKRITNVFLL